VRNKKLVPLLLRGPKHVNSLVFFTPR